MFEKLESIKQSNCDGIQIENRKNQDILTRTNEVSKYSQQTERGFAEIVK